MILSSHVYLDISSLHRHIKKYILQPPCTSWYFQYLGIRGKNELKQSEIKIKIDNDTENDNQKETLTDLYVSNLFKRGFKLFRR